MTFDEFKTNIHNWATERRVYAHSTPLTQALGAVVAVGELCNGVIKNDIDAIKGAIGDVAVCLVNVAEMRGEELEIYQSGKYKSTETAAACVSSLLGDIAQDLAIFSHSCPDLNEAVSELSACADVCDLDFLACCEAAWLKIKDESHV